jgi:hypothetical protein
MSEEKPEMATTGAGVNAAASVEPQSGVSRIDWRREVGLPVAAALGLGTLILGWAQFIPSQGMAYWLAGATLASLPVMALLMYRRAARQAGRTLLLAAGGRLHPWANGRVFGTLLITAGTFPAAMLALAMAARYSPIEKVLLLLGMISVVIFQAIFRRPLKRESRLPRVAECWAGHTAIISSTVLLTLAVYAQREWIGMELEFVTIQEARAHFQAAYPLTSGSGSVVEVQMWLAGYDAFHSLALGYVEYWVSAGWSVVVALVLDFGSYWFLLAIAAACAVPFAEYRWIIAAGAMDDEPVVSNVKAVGVPLLAAVVLTGMQYGIARNADSAAAYALKLRKATEVWSAEIIDGNPYQPGTLRLIDELDASIKDRKDRSVDEAERLVRAEFAVYRGRVDDFLDWNYSLKADYVLSIMAVTGKLEETLQENLELKIFGSTDLPKQYLENIHERLSSDLDSLEGQRMLERRALLQKNRLETNSIGIVVTETSTLSSRTGSILAARMKLAQQRVGASIAAGLLARKLLRGRAFEALKDRVAKAVAKKIAAKAAANVGGSFIPGPVGLLWKIFSSTGATTLIVGKVGVEVDEMFYREDMKSEITEMLLEAEEQALAPLRALRAAGS